MPIRAVTFDFDRDEARMRELDALGMDGVVSDRPELARAALAGGRHAWTNPL